MKACQKTKVTYEDVQRIADNIERGLSNTMEKEIQSTSIGLLIMEELKAIDQVAYVRFASVYREFQTIDTFIDEINKLNKNNKKK
jgi:transcriptional repressor NrdR